jgi:protocatechuate 3,4-dioxygenase beta subunit
MRKLTVVLAGLILAAGLHARFVSGITGRVSDAQTQAPIRGAEIVASGPNGSGTARSESCGGYQILNLPHGKYRVMAAATGYHPGFFAESVLVYPDRITPNINIALQPVGAQNGVIHGRVTDARTGLPIGGAQLGASGPHGQGTATSYPCGNYFISVPPGSYRVVAEAQGYVPAVFRESVPVGSGDTTHNINFALEPVSGQNGRISGRVFDLQTRAPIQGAHVVANNRSGSWYAVTESSGVYEIENLPPGKYRVRAEAAHYKSATFPESVIVTAGHTTPNINFHLEPLGGSSGGISGRVVDAVTELPIRGAVILASGPNGHGSTHTESCGRYMLGDLPPGRYQVRAEALGYFAATLRESVLVTAGQTTPNVNFALEPRGGQNGGIAGMVVNALTREPIFGARVVAEGPGRGQANTNERGTYYIGDLPPGSYVVQASARGFQPAVRERVPVEPGRVTHEICFALEPEPGGTGAIAGLVFDSAHRRPIRGAVVFASGRAGQARGVTDSAGRYELAGLRAGRYQVRAHARGYYPATFRESVAVEVGRTTPVNFHLARTRPLDAGISGFAYDGVSQTELPGAIVTATGPGGTAQALTDDFGDYLLTGLEPGEYTISVSGNGYLPGQFPEPVLVENEVISAFTSPAMYPLPAAQEPRPGASATALLLRVEPSPADARSIVSFSLPQAGAASLRVFDAAGRLQATLFTGHVEAGLHAVQLAGPDRLEPGIYLVRLTTPDTNASAKVVVN